eukprot:jgi/Psemu1/10341/gm1.10341_g
MKLSFTSLLFLALAFAQVASASSPNDDLHKVRRYLTEEEESGCVISWWEKARKDGSGGVGGVMKFKNGAFVKQASAAKTPLGTIMVSSAGPVKVEDMSNDDPRHFSNTAKTTRNFRTLVVRIIDSLNKEPDSALTLRREIFTDIYNLETQFKACSHGQMTTEDADIVDVKVNIPLTEDSNIYDSGNAAKAEAEKKYGGSAGLAKKEFGAFAPLNSFDSYCQHRWYTFPSVQMHEIGHDLGLEQCTKDGEELVEYGDRASLMGSIAGEGEGPYCFNHNYQLRWYENQQLSIKPMELSSPQTFVLNGIDHYTNGKLVVLRLDYYGSEYQGWDFYVGHNSATGIKSGTKPEFAATVTVLIKIKGGQYGVGKTKRWKHSEGKGFTIIRPEPNLPDVYIDFQSIQNGGTDAIVVISNSGGVGPKPTPQPTPCEDDLDFKFKGKEKQNCEWVGKGNLNKKKVKKIQKKCKKKVSGKKKVWYY